MRRVESKYVRKENIYYAQFYSKLSEGKTPTDSLEVHWRVTDE